MTKESGMAKGWRTAKFARRVAICLFALGIAACLAGALLMWDGSILGENHAGIATIAGEIGIGLIGTSGAVATGIAASRKNAEGTEP